MFFFLFLSVFIHRNPINSFNYFIEFIWCRYIIYYVYVPYNVDCGVLFFLSFRNNFWMENQQAFLLTNEQNMRRKQLVSLFLSLFNSWKSVVETTKLIFLVLFLIGTWFYYVFFSCCWWPENHRRYLYFDVPCKTYS